MNSYPLNNSATLDGFKQELPVHGHTTASCCDLNLDLIRSLQTLNFISFSLSEVDLLVYCCDIILLHNPMAGPGFIVGMLFFLYNTVLVI